MKIKLSIILALGILFGGCANTTALNAVRIANKQAERDGFPFRWRVESVEGGAMMYQEMLPLPSAPSRAGGILKRDTLHLIEKAEQANGRPMVELADVKHLPDGREAWLLKYGAADGLAYIVDYQPSAHGGTDIALNGPIRFKK